MTGERATLALEGTCLGPVEWVAETGSTNADLMARAALGAAEGLVLVADHQTAGRGRLGRRWEAPPGSSLLVSILLRPTLSVDDTPLITMALGLSALEACGGATGADVGLKWPNDLVVPGQPNSKLGGMLAESVIEAHGEAGPVTVLVIGIGINVDWPRELPDELALTATALNLLQGHSQAPPDREGILIDLLVGFAERYALLDTKSGRRAVLDDYRRRCVTIGQRVRVERNDTSLVGEVIDVDDQGRLLLDTGSGLEVIAVGDVVHLRPA